MSIQKKSLINTLKTTKKANLASTPVAAKGSMTKSASAKRTAVKYSAAKKAAVKYSAASKAEF